MIKNLNQLERLLANNAPVILTALGVTGTISTAVLAGRATVKATDRIRLEEDVGGMHGDPVERFKERLGFAWQFYIPPVASGAFTIVCIVGANRIGNRRAIAMASAYSLAEKGFSEYRDKVTQKFGENKERSVRDSVAQDKVTKNPASAQEVFIVGTGDVLCYEALTGRYFMSTMERLKRAENKINHQLLNDAYASLSDLFDEFGLARTEFSEEVGWKNNALLELRFSGTLSEDDRPCISIAYRVEPVRNYFREH